MTRVLAMLGRAGSGKSTALEYLGEVYGAKTARFSGPLKELAKEVWEFSDEQVYGSAVIKEQHDDRVGMSPRQALQRLGDGARRHIRPTVWIEALAEQIVRESSGNDLFVVEDCRYVNEATMIATSTRFHGKVIKLECPKREATADELHPSEVQVDQVPSEFIYATITNHFDAEFFTALDTVILNLGWG
jgi:hypothetical protein